MSNVILAVDTATRWTGLALHDGAAIVAEHGWQSFNTQTIELAPAVDRMLQQAGLTAGELKGIVVAIGPGSYTGLRIGLGFAKGLAIANQVPLIGVPTLDIVAASLAGMTGQLVVVAEAGRTRVCAATYEWQRGRGWQKSGRPTIEAWDELLGRLEGATTFAGEVSPEAAKKIRAHKEFRLLPPAASVRRAGYLAEIGWLRLRKERVDDAATLAPIYLRDPAGN